MALGIARSLPQLRPCAEGLADSHSGPTFPAAMLSKRTSIQTAQLSFPMAYDKSEPMRRWFLAGILLLTILSSCSGGSGSGPSIPIVQWSGFRHDSSNSALASGAVEENPGQTRFTIDTGRGGSLYPIPGPAIGSNGTIYLGADHGLLALNDSGKERWRFDCCLLKRSVSVCGAIENSCIPVGTVASTPAVTPNDDLVVISSTGCAFGIHDNGDSYDCLWASEIDGSPSAALRSSPQVLFDTSDLMINTVLVGSQSGFLLALNGDGTPKWRFPADSMGFGGPVTSSAAVTSIGNILLSGSDGFLYSLDLAGRIVWKRSNGIVDESIAPLPSPSVAVSIFTSSGSNALIAYNPDGSFKWEYDAALPLAGSPAYAQQTLVEVQDRPFEAIVYAVDEAGTLYGIRDSNGQIFVPRRCSQTTTMACFEDADCPNSNQGETCNDRPAPVPITASPITVQLSPVVSGDLFAVVGSVDGRLCARHLDGHAPTPTSTSTPVRWDDGCIPVGDGQPIQSSPVIDRAGTIYVLAGGILHAIGEPL
jgi:outer membrane protein assembly factor BamB